MFLLLPFNVILDVITRGIRQKRIEMHTNYQGIGITLFSDEIILYIEIPKESTRD